MLIVACCLAVVGCRLLSLVVVGCLLFEYCCVLVVVCCVVCVGCWCVGVLVCW